MTTPQWSWQGRLAFSGVLAGHCLVYTLRSPEAAFHHPMSAGGGHSAGFLLASLVVASAAAGVVAFAAERRRDAVHRTLLLRTAARLARLQLAGFLGLELAERLLFSPRPLPVLLAHLLTEPAVLLGLGLQVGIAVAAAVFLGLVVEVVLRRRRTAPAHPSAGLALHFPPTVPPPRTCAGVESRTSRGPPSPSIAAA